MKRLYIAAHQTGKAFGGAFFVQSDRSYVGGSLPATTGIETTIEANLHYLAEALTIVSKALNPEAPEAPEAFFILFKDDKETFCSYIVSMLENERFNKTLSRGRLRNSFDRINDILKKNNLELKVQKTQKPQEGSQKPREKLSEAFVRHMTQTDGLAKQVSEALPEASQKPSPRGTKAVYKKVGRK